MNHLNPDWIALTGFLSGASQLALGDWVIGFTVSCAVALMSSVFD